MLCLLRGQALKHPVRACGGRLAGVGDPPRSRSEVARGREEAPHRMSRQDHVHVARPVARPLLGQNDPYSALKTTLKAEINQEAWDTLHGDTSRPFARPKGGRIAVKVINHLGDG